jgi:NAD-dependent dihydropyrimidine dehydrogenase PreA subunit
MQFLNLQPIEFPKVGNSNPAIPESENPGEEPRICSSEKAKTAHLGTTRPKQVKRIPPELRKGRPSYLSERNPYRRALRRWSEDPHFLRSTVQLAFVGLCGWIGVEFALFVKWGLSGGNEAFVERPPGVEGFLPISALISLKYWLQTGIINDIHPAAMFILIAIVVLSIVARKGFCSWLCPIGTLSEALWNLGARMFGRNLIVTPWLDYPLRSLKYLLLFFFVWSIAGMDVSDLKAFIYSPYNKVADIKMYQFFAAMSGTALVTIIVLIVLSIPIKNFWCRYLCPYGALLSIAGWLSPLKVERSPATCIDCDLCSKACPSGINVHKVKRVWSDECTNCLACVQACPVKNTLEVKTGFRSRTVSPRMLGVLIVGIFIAVTGAAMLSGHWSNGIPKDEYLKRFQRLDSYQHSRGEVPEYGPND